jgi:hypothetical protein
LLGLGELALIAVAFLLVGGGGAGALVAAAKRAAMRHAEDTLRDEAKRVVPPEVQQAADAVRKLQRGELPGLGDGAAGTDREPR